MHTKNDAPRKEQECEHAAEQLYYRHRSELMKLALKFLAEQQAKQ